MVEIRVADTGVGIPPEALPHVFDMFMQADHALSRSQGGLGIGLTLVKNLVEMHGGTVEAHSAGVGQGSEFIVRLPLLPTRGHSAAGSPEDEPAANLPPCRILVVDDNPDAAQSVVLVLSAQGHEVRSAHSGLEALALARTFRPEVVLLDISMPGMTGYEVARQLRECRDIPQPLLIAMTGLGQEADRRRSREAGLDHHLVKPVDPKALHKLLAAWHAARQTTT
jgi:CheY-like chemotaxis protein